MKRTYYYCDAGSMVYTEKEKIRSVWPACRFTEIGKFESRRAAEDHCERDMGLYVCYNSNATRA